MIIACNNCSKKFNVDAKAIPENGRLLQCSGCNYKWFFKKEIKNQAVAVKKTTIASNKNVIFKEEVVSKEAEKPKIKELLDEPVTNDSEVENVSFKDKIKKNKKSYNIFRLTIIFIISFVALIIFLDTLQAPIAKIFPRIEFFLYNLYETINDIKLFFNDLI